MTKVIVLFEGQLDCEALLKRIEFDKPNPEATVNRIKTERIDIDNTFCDKCCRLMPGE